MEDGGYNVFVVRNFLQGTQDQVDTVSWFLDVKLVDFAGIEAGVQFEGLRSEYTEALSSRALGQMQMSMSRAEAGYVDAVYGYAHTFGRFWD